MKSSFLEALWSYSQPPVMIGKHTLARPAHDSRSKPQICSVARIWCDYRCWAGFMSVTFTYSVSMQTSKQNPYEHMKEVRKHMKYRNEMYKRLTRVLYMLPYSTLYTFVFHIHKLLHTNSMQCSLTVLQAIFNRLSKVHSIIIIIIPCVCIATVCC